MSNPYDPDLSPLDAALHEIGNNMPMDANGNLVDPNDLWGSDIGTRQFDHEYRDLQQPLKNSTAPASITNKQWFRVLFHLNRTAEALLYVMRELHRLRTDGVLPIPDGEQHDPNNPNA